MITLRLLVIIIATAGSIGFFLMNLYFSRREHKEHKKFPWGDFARRMIPTTQKHGEMARDVACNFYGKKNVDKIENFDLFEFLRRKRGGSR